MAMLEMNKVIEGQIYTRGEAAKAIGINAVTFDRYFKDNEQFAKYGTEKIGKRVFYTGFGINKRIDVIELEYHQSKIEQDAKTLSYAEFIKKYPDLVRKQVNEQKRYL